MELEIKRLHAEIERLTECLARANASSEKFEREWYLRGDVLDATEYRLGSLLAVIHRDGGHYQTEHGTEKACADAELAVHVQRGIADGYHDAIKIWRHRAEQAEARLAAIDGAPAVAIVRTALGTDYKFVSFCVLERDQPGDMTELIARPAKG